MALTKIKSHSVAVNSLTVANIADNAIDATKIASNSILTRHIDDAQITTDQILDGTIATADIADDAVTAAKLANSINTDIATGPAALPKAGGTMTGTLTVAGSSSGTVDAIIITNTDTTNNGLSIGVDSSENAFFWNGSNTSMNFATNNTERMRIEADGDAAFAANATGAALIKGVSGNQADRNNSGYPQYTFVGNEGTGMRRVSSNILAFDSSGAERMRIDSSGNVGIGTQSPQSGLHIAEGGSGADGGSVLTLSQTGFGSIVNNDDLGSVHFGGVTSGGVGIPNAAKIMVEGDATWASNDYPTRMTFHTTADGAASATERMRIDSSGNVSMGQSFTSGANLHVEDTSDSMLLIYETGTSPYTATLKLASQSMSSYGSNVQYTSGAEQLTIENYGRALSAGSTSGSIRFRTKVGNGSLSEVMIINGHEGTITQPHQTFFMTNRSAGNQTFANAAWVDVDWTGEPYDTGGNYVLSSGVFTAPIAGVYLFTGLIGFNTIAATNYVLARIVCSSAGDFYTTHEQKRNGGGDYGYDHAISQMIYLAASETVKMSVFAGSGGDHSIGSRSNWQGRLLG